MKLASVMSFFLLGQQFVENKCCDDVDNVSDSGSIVKRQLNIPLC
jgi:hypothetical protein